MKISKALMAAFTLVVGSTAMAGSSQDLMTRGKVAADLGDHRAAENAFSAVARDTEAAPGERAEALVRLGAAQRAAGERPQSAVTFRKAVASADRDAQSTRLLTLALTGVAPAGERWASDWSRVRVAANEGPDGSVAVQWPAGPAGRVRAAFPATDPVTLDLDDYPLERFLFFFMAGTRSAVYGSHTSQEEFGWPDAYRPPSDVDDLDVVIHANVKGSVTIKASGRPWNELFESVLTSHGLGFARDGNLVFIAPLDDLAAFAPHRGRSYGGARVTANVFSFAFGPGGQSIDSGLGMLSGASGYRFAPDAGLTGRLSTKLTERPVLEHLDLFLMSNGLAAVPQGEGTLRICRAGDTREAADLSKVASRSPHALEAKAGEKRGMPMSSLWALPLDGNSGAVRGKPARLDVKTQPAVHGLSADGRFLAYSAEGPGSTVRVKDLATGKEATVTDERGGMAPVLSRDGGTVVYLSYQGIVSIPAAGGAIESVCGDCQTPKGPNKKMSDFPVAASPDGRFLLVQHDGQEHGTLQAVDVHSKKRVEILKHPQLRFSRAEFSPDGQWIAFHMGPRMRDGKGHVFIARFRGLAAIPETQWTNVTSDVDWSDGPAWSPDGGMLYYVSERDGSQCIWAQKLDPVRKQPAGAPFAVHHLHGTTLMGMMPFGHVDLSVSADKLIYGVLNSLSEPDSPDVATR